jgi:uncharacterized membrane protein YhaH (DUF805 family)
MLYFVPLFFLYILTFSKFGGATAPLQIFGLWLVFVVVFALLATSRLGNIGLSKSWAYLMIVPVVNLILAIYLCSERENVKRRTPKVSCGTGP